MSEDIKIDGEVIDIIFVVKDKADNMILGLFHNEIDAQELVALTKNSDYESWCIEKEGPKLNFKYTKKEMYDKKDIVFFRTFSHSGILTLDYSDHDYNGGFENILYHGRDKNDKDFWILGYEIYGVINKWNQT